MIDRDSVEKALLFGIVRDRNWNTLILNNIYRDHFAANNREIYDYIKSFVDKGTYPEFPVLCYRFQIDETTMNGYLGVKDLDSLCDLIRREYLINNIVFKVNGLNSVSGDMYNNPEKYVEKFTSISNELKQLCYHTKSVGLFDHIEDILTIDKSNVIGTGFAELDEKLVGWRRGEDLIVFMGRTGQGKSWMGLKFAMKAAESGEHVGIYSGEMSTQQLQERIICCGKKNYSSTKEEVIKQIKEANLDIKVLTQKELRRKANVDDIEEFIIRDHLTMLVVDQLSLMEDNTCKPGTPIRQQYGNISMDLFTLSTKYNLPIILLVQSNRQGGETKEGPGLENIAESDAVAQNATRVISMKNEHSRLTLRILKNRYGDSNLIQQYDIDFGINKYTPLDNNSTQTATRHKGESIYGRMKTGY